MAEPELVADCVASMRAVVDIPVTVKCRIGIDECDDYTFLEKFVTQVAGAGCDTFIIHARKAWLKGLSPKENREIPPLRYDIAARIKEKFPELAVILNGGLTTAEQVRDAMKNFDGVMIGREAYHNPYFLAELEQEFFGTPLPDRFEICEKMVAYADKHPNDSVHSITRHILGLFHGLRGAKGFRQVLSTDVHTMTSASNLLEKALKSVKPL
jgi:tRNA-dihydrouridine synthase A